MYMLISMSVSCKLIRFGSFSLISTFLVVPDKSRVLLLDRGRLCRSELESP